MKMICIYYRANVAESNQKAVDEELLLMEQIKCMILYIIMWLVSLLLTCTWCFYACIRGAVLDKT